MSFKPRTLKYSVKGKKSKPAPPKKVEKKNRGIMSEGGTFLGK